MVRVVVFDATIVDQASVHVRATRASYVSKIRSERAMTDTTGKGQYVYITDSNNRLYHLTQRNFKRMSIATKCASRDIYVEDYGTLIGKSYSFVEILSKNGELS